jgi:Trk-type K+ transport system membrane component
MLYFLILTPLAGVLIYLVEGCAFIDAFFVATSAMTCTGLTTLDVSKATLATQIILMFLFFIGSPALATAFPLVIRLIRFQKMFATMPPHAFDSTDLQLEYSRRNAIVLMLVIVVGYYALVQLLAATFLSIYSATEPDAIAIYKQYNVDSTWSSFFLSAAGYNNTGFTLFPNSVIPFSDQWCPLLVMMLLILLGNTAFPIGLRVVLLVIQVLARIARIKSEELRLLDEQSRLFYTHMFPWKDTLQLLVMLIVTNAVQFGFQLGLDWSLSLRHLSPFYKVWNALFQSISTRAAGFNSYVLIESSAAVQLLFVGMMYLAVYPVFSSVRTTQARPDDAAKWASVKSVLLADLAVVFIVTFTLALCLYKPLQYDPEFTLFKVIWEAVSAFSTVGSSLGYGNDNTSFCGRFNVPGKLLLIFTMLLGRHRGLPESGDIALGGVPEEKRLDLGVAAPRKEFEFNLAQYLTERKRKKQLAYLGHSVDRLPTSAEERLSFDLQTDDRTSMDYRRPSWDRGRTGASFERT